MDRPRFFISQDDFRRWLEKNHDKKRELWVGFYKVGTGKPSMSWTESVDQALCFGWIDGIRRSLGPEAYTIRFTPRRPGSVWSAVNIRKVGELMDRGMMQRPGLEIFEKRTEARSAAYAYEKRPDEFGVDLERRFRTYKKAWDFFWAQPAWYQRRSIHYVISAKREKTRINRLEKLILASEASERL